MFRSRTRVYVPGTTIHSAFHWKLINRYPSFTLFYFSSWPRVNCSLPVCYYTNAVSTGGLQIAPPHRARTPRTWARPFRCFYLQSPGQWVSWRKSTREPTPSIESVHCRSHVSALLLAVSGEYFLSVFCIFSTAGCWVWKTNGIAKANCEDLLCYAMSYQGPVPWSISSCNVQNSNVSQSGRIRNRWC